MRGEFEKGILAHAAGEAVIPSLEAIGVKCLQVYDENDVIKTIQAALIMAFKAERSIAVLLSQKLLDRKNFRNYIYEYVKFR